MENALLKIDFKDAVELLDAGCYLMHLNYLMTGTRSEIYRENWESCSHFLVEGGRDWRNPQTPIVLVRKDREAEQKYLESRAGKEKYGTPDTDRSYTDLMVENQLLHKVIRVFLHDSGSPLSVMRNGLANFEYWADRAIEAEGDEEAASRLKRIRTNIIAAVDNLCEFRSILWRSVDRRNLPSNNELSNIISDLEKVLSEAEEAQGDASETES